MDSEWRDRLRDLYQQRDLEVLRKLQGLVYTARMESGSILSASTEHRISDR